MLDFKRHFAAGAKRMTKTTTYFEFIAYRFLATNKISKENSLVTRKLIEAVNVEIEKSNDGDNVDAALANLRGILEDYSEALLEEVR